LLGGVYLASGPLDVVLSVLATLSLVLMLVVAFSIVLGFSSPRP
jgi:hypothetical protein